MFTPILCALGNSRLLRAILAPALSTNSQQTLLFLLTTPRFFLYARLRISNGVSGHDA
jgi:hypothetical protein